MTELSPCSGFRKNSLIWYRYSAPLSGDASGSALPVEKSHSLRRVWQTTSSDMALPQSGHISSGSVGSQSGSRTELLSISALSGE